MTHAFIGQVICNGVATTVGIFATQQESRQAVVKALEQYKKRFPAYNKRSLRGDTAMYEIGKYTANFN